MPTSRSVESSPRQPSPLSSHTSSTTSSTSTNNGAADHAALGQGTAVVTHSVRDHSRPLHHRQRRRNGARIQNEPRSLSVQQRHTPAQMGSQAASPTDRPPFVRASSAPASVTGTEAAVGSASSRALAGMAVPSHGIAATTTGSNRLNAEVAHSVAGIDHNGRESVGPGNNNDHGTSDHVLHFEASNESPADAAVEINPVAIPASPMDPPALPSAPSILSAKLQAELAENFHFVTIPLMIMATVAIGFMLVYLKDVLVPFVIGVFLVYLLKPWVKMISRPCSGIRSMQRCIRRRAVSAGSYTSLPTMSRRIAYDETVQYKRDDIRPAVSNDIGISNASSSALHVDPAWGKARSDVESGVGQGIAAPGVSAATGLVGTGGIGLGIGSPAQLNRRRQAGSMPLDGDDDACRCPYWLAVVVTLAGFGGAVSAMFLLVLGSIEAFKEDGLELYMQQAVFVGNYTLSWLYDGWGIEADKLLVNYVLEMPVAALAKDIMVYALGLCMNMFLILLVTSYLIFENSADPGASSPIYEQVDEQIQKYIGLKSAISLVAAVLVFLVFALLQIRLAYFFAFITFLLNYIPNVGPVIATFLPIPVIAFDPELPFGSMLLAVLVPGAIHFVVGNVIEPAIFGHSMELHPVVVLLSLTLWYALWGVTGAILAVPIVAVLRIVVSHNHHPYARVVLATLTGLPGSSHSLRTV